VEQISTNRCVKRFRKCATNAPFRICLFHICSIYYRWEIQKSCIFLDLQNMECVETESGFTNSLASTELHALNWQPNGSALTTNKTDVERLFYLHPIHLFTCPSSLMWALGALEQSPCSYQISELRSHSAVQSSGTPQTIWLEQIKELKEREQRIK
jgi:hypothetical protein